MLTYGFFLCSSGDSTGVKPDDQKARYDDVVKRRPSTLLSLEHEVYGMFNFSLFDVSFFAECTFFQNPACKSLLFLFCCCLIRRNMLFFTDMKSFHTRSKSFKKRDTNWLRLLNVLGNNLTIVRVLLLHEMYVKSFLFSPAYF